MAWQSPGCGQSQTIPLGSKWRPPGQSNATANPWSHLQNLEQSPGKGSIKPGRHWLWTHGGQSLDCGGGGTLPPHFFAPPCTTQIASRALTTVNIIHFYFRTINHYAKKFVRFLKRNVLCSKRWANFWETYSSWVCCKNDSVHLILFDWYEGKKCQRRAQDNGVFKIIMFHNLALTPS